MNANFGNHIVRMYGDYDKMRKLASLVIAIDPKKLGNPVLQNHGENGHGAACR